MKEAERYEKIVAAYKTAQHKLCDCPLFQPCSCKSQERYENETGNKYFREDEHVYCKVGNESVYADFEDLDKPVFLFS